VVENRPGASGVVGLGYVARSKPDGYTLGLGGIGSVVLRSAFEGERSIFDAQRELQPVAIIAKESPVLIVSKHLNVSSLKDLVALSHQQQLTYGSPGVGSAMHLAGELFSQETGARMIHVPYKGQGNAFSDLLGGQISLVFTDVSVALPYAQDDRVRIVAIAGRERSRKLPNVPTMAELGFAKMVMENWYAIYAARGTPPALINKITDALRTAMALPQIRGPISETSGLTPIVEGPQELEKQTSEDNARWRPIAAKARGS
jgi:tripartite-type tricarboxylate transporter receptor subunit TctC